MAAATAAAPAVRAGVAWLWARSPGTKRAPASSGAASSGAKEKTQ
jgi:hypothetical protein